VNRRKLHSIGVCVAICSVSFLLLGVGASAGSVASGSASGAPAQGGTATFAELPGYLMNYIFPLISGAYDTTPNATQFSNAIYPPLYWEGGPGTVGVNEPSSIAKPAVISYKNGRTIATVTLKPWKWSNGQQITSRDVQFWFNLMKVEKVEWWDYIPGEFPDNVMSFVIETPSTFVVTFSGHYGSLYTYNELDQLTPIPQILWDKTSMSGAVGNYDLTPAGAKAVYAFLNTQSKDITTYATNPLWQVVDGAWKIQSFNPATTALTLARNDLYSGPATGKVSHFEVLQFTSSASEYSALLSGSIDFGYVPVSDVPQVSRLEAMGYQVVGWKVFGFTFLAVNFANKKVGPLFRQLYIRQALQEQINQPLDISAILKGYGYPSYGPVPDQPPNVFLSTQQRTNPYPYSPSKAMALLRSHGWKVVPGGSDVCQRAGTAADECGAGIPKGMLLAISATYTGGIPSMSDELQGFKSDLAAIGVNLALAGQPFSQVLADWAPCSGPSCWQMIYYATPAWVYNDNLSGPFGDEIFYTNGITNAGRYSSAEADQLLTAVHSGSMAAVYSYENFISKQLPVLWFPNTDFEIAVIKDSLKGALPLDPDQNLYPQNWYFAK